MKCPNCQTDNPVNEYHCQKCNVALSADPLDINQQATQPPDYKQTLAPSKKGKWSMLKKIAIVEVIVLIFISSCVLSGIIYSFVRPLPNTEDAPYIHFSITDASGTAGMDNNFSSGEDMIKLVQTSSSAINWTTMTAIKCTINDSDYFILLNVLKIKSKAYSPSNAISKYDDKIILGIGGNETIPAGSRLTVRIIDSSDNYLWKSSPVIVS